MVTREAIIEAARGWLGTPYHHQARRRDLTRVASTLTPDRAAGLALRRHPIHLRNPPCSEGDRLWTALLGFSPVASPKDRTDHGALGGGELGGRRRNPRRPRHQGPGHLRGLGLAALGVKVDDAKATKTAGTKPAKAKW